ncbi:MAG: hypothetical protein PHP89_06900 [Candidatus Omnitrophica bacterium]|jgi:hypothetical protein|nr:hypothetical protein [Candidatus Omnitrophota bacterium]MDD4982262.1 hypothetical protein [Candidatus Omnitrophota bacterium]
MKFSKKVRAIKLREKGLSYAEIRKVIPISKSTLSVWLKDIKLSKQQKLRLSGLQATGYIGAKKNQIMALSRHKEIRETAAREAINLLKDSFFVAGLMLYWAEGDKRSGGVQFSNSDWEMVKLMMKWFRKFCSVPEEKFRIGLFIHTLHTRENCINFWSNITKIPINQFNKPYIKPAIFSNRKNKLYEGTCAIKIHSRDLMTRILGWLDQYKKNYV